MESQRAEPVRGECILGPCSRASSEARLVARLVKKKRARKKKRFTDLKKKKKAKKKQERKEQRNAGAIKEVHAAWDGAAAEQEAAAAGSKDGSGGGSLVVKGVDGIAAAATSTEVVVLTGTDDVGDSGVETEAKAVERRAAEGVAERNTRMVVDFSSSRGMSMEDVDGDEEHASASHGTSTSTRLENYSNSTGMSIGNGDTVTARSSMASGQHTARSSIPVSRIGEIQAKMHEIQPAAPALHSAKKLTTSKKVLGTLVMPATPSPLPGSSSRSVTEGLHAVFQPVQPLRDLHGIHEQGDYFPSPPQTRPVVASPAGPGAVTESAGHSPGQGSRPTTSTSPIHDTSAHNSLPDSSPPAALSSQDSAGRDSVPSTEHDSVPSTGRDLVPSTEHDSVPSAPVPRISAKPLPPWERAAKKAAEQLEAKVRPGPSCAHPQNQTPNSPVTLTRALSHLTSSDILSAGSTFELNIV